MINEKKEKKSTSGISRTFCAWVLLFLAMGVLYPLLSAYWAYISCLLSIVGSNTCELEQVHTCQPSRILRIFTHFSLPHLAISSHFQLSLAFLKQLIRYFWLCSDVFIYFHSRRLTGMHFRDTKVNGARVVALQNRKKSISTSSSLITDLWYQVA